VRKVAGSLETSRHDLRHLADEQAAWRRVATLVARSGSPSDVFATVTREVGLLSGAAWRATCTTASSSVSSTP
jgi:hypothetical protein